MESNCNLRDLFEWIFFNSIFNQILMSDNLKRKRPKKVIESLKLESTVDCSTSNTLFPSALCSKYFPYKPTYNYVTSGSNNCLLVCVDWKSLQILYIALKACLRSCLAKACSLVILCLSEVDLPLKYGWWAQTASISKGLHQHCQSVWGLFEMLYWFCFWHNKT